MGKRLSFFLLLFAVTVTLSGRAAATPGFNVVGLVLARGSFVEPVDVKLKLGADPVQVIHVPDARQTVIQQETLGPGGHTGWHSHPGPALVVVKRGALALFDGDDPDCAGEVFAAGQSFIDAGQGHVHIGVNANPDAAGETELWVTYLDVPVGGAFRNDAADPGNCSF